VVFEEFASLLSQICSHSPLAQGRPLVWTIIANPRAGGFAIRSRWKQHRAQLAQCAAKAAKNPPREGMPSQTALRAGGSAGLLGLVLTKGPGSAREITAALLEEAHTAPGLAAGRGQPFHLIITAGGDGTSREVMASLFRASPQERDKFAILRLPLGTGNDGADAWDLDKALDLIIEPSDLARQRALRLRTASGKGPFLAFNILSVGIDAFVTHMTNKTKGRLPGDSYKIWVNIAALFYDLAYKVGSVEVISTDAGGNEVKRFNERLLLLAVGESGRRTYGSRKWILPDDRNVCAIKRTSLFRKLALNGLMNTGGHAGEPEAMIWSAQTVEFRAQYPLLAQMDGETVRLENADFPATIELTEPHIPILRSVTNRCLS